MLCKSCTPPRACPLWHTVFEPGRGVKDLFCLKWLFGLGKGKIVSRSPGTPLVGGGNPSLPGRRPNGQGSRCWWARSACLRAKIHPPWHADLMRSNPLISCGCSKRPGLRATVPARLGVASGADFVFPRLRAPDASKGSRHHHLSSPKERTPPAPRKRSWLM